MDDATIEALASGEPDPHLPVASWPVMTRDQHSAISNVHEAVLFFDRVKAATSDERTAVGRDHWDWLETAARLIVETFPRNKT